MECVSATAPFLKLQKTSLSVNLPFVRLRNLNVMTFFAAGMLLVSQNSGGAAASPGDVASGAGALESVGLAASWACASGEDDPPSGSGVPGSPAGDGLSPQ